MCNLLDLVKDVDYQDAFDYEKRAYLFNKYQIPTNTKFLVPIWELAQYIVSLGSYNKKTFASFGHGQTILDIDLHSKIETNEELRIAISKKKDTISIKTVDHDAKSVPKFGKYRTMLIFDLEKKRVKISRRVVHIGSYEIVRDFYTKIDNWLIDFEYKKWEDEQKL